MEQTDNINSETTLEEKGMHRMYTCLFHVLLYIQLFNIYYYFQYTIKKKYYWTRKWWACPLEF